MTIKDLLDKRATIHSQMNDLLAQAGDDGLNEDQERQFNLWDGEFNELTKQIDRQRIVDERNALMAEEHGERMEREPLPPEASEDPQENEARYKEAFDAYCRFGYEELNSESRKILRAGYVEERAQSTTGSAGGYMIPQGFSNELEIALKEFGGMRRAARILPTSTGNALKWPTVNDTANVSAILAENGDADASTTDVTFAEKTLNAYKTNPGVLRTSRELLTDSAIPVESVLGRLMGERTGRFENQWFTTGTGSSQPNGAVTAASQGVYAAEPTTFTYLEMLALIHSINPAYRRGGSVYFMMNDLTLLALKKLVVGSSDARPLWQPSTIVGEPDRIAGFPYIINQDMANLAASAKTILFGDFSKFIIRDVGTPYFRRLDERYADYDQVGWILFTRVDSELVDAGGGALKYMQMHSS